MSKLSDVPGELFDVRRSPKQRYQQLVIGRLGLRPLLLYELIISLCSNLPGALGLLLRKVLYPLLLGSCGHNVNFGRGITLRHPHKIYIGNNVAVDDNCTLDAKGQNNQGITIGDRVFLGRNTIIACKDGDILLADGANISYQCTVFSASTVRIGKDTLLAAYCYLVGGNHQFDNLDLAIVHQERTSEGIEIGAKCWIGAGARILDGVTMGNAAIVGANAVVSRDVPARTIVGGVPAVVLRDRRNAATQPDTT